MSEDVDFGLCPSCDKFLSPYTRPGVLSCVDHKPSTLTYNASVDLQKTSESIKSFEVDDAKFQDLMTETHKQLLNDYVKEIYNSMTEEDKFYYNWRATFGYTNPFPISTPRTILYPSVV
jgi:hypothetical protein